MTDATGSQSLLGAGYSRSADDEVHVGVVRDALNRVPPTEWGKGPSPYSALAVLDDRRRRAYRIIGQQDAALRTIIKAARDYVQGCECSGSGVVTDCPGTFSEGCCGACESEPCECCPELLAAIYQAEEALNG